MSAPTYVNGQNVFVSQEKQRKMFDTLNISIVGLSPSWVSPPPLNQFPGNFVPAERHYFPSGVVFTFPQPYQVPHSGPNVVPQQMWSYTSGPYIPNPMTLRNCYPPPTAPPLSPSPQHPPGVYRSFPGACLRSPECQEQLSQNPFYFQQQQLPTYKLKFHLNEGTSCSDLLNGNTQVPGSQGTPDFNNLAGVMNQQEQSIHYPGSFTTGCMNRLIDHTNGPICNPNITDNFNGNARQLLINKPVMPPQQHVADILDEQKPFSEEQSTKKSVTFCERCPEETAEKSDQTNFPCDCHTAKNDESKNDAKTSESKSKLKKFFSRKSKKEENQEYSSDNSEKEQPRRKKTDKGKKRKPKEKKEEPEYDADTSDSDFICYCQ